MSNPRAPHDAAEPLLLPAADAVQPDHPSQWWYWSGHLAAESGRRFGFQAAFFAAEAVRGVLWGQMGHAAIIDLESGRFVRESRLWLGAPRRIEGRFDLGGPDGALRARGGDGRDRLELRVGDLALDLHAAGGPTIAHYEGLAHDYEFGGYTYYYSRPRMRGVGSLRSGGEPLAVAGDVWFDRQYGDLSAALYEGWQWLSIHLEDGATIMVFRFNRTARERFAAIVDPGGAARWIDAEGFELAALESWTSTRTGIEYPIAWRLRVDGYDLVIRTSAPAQEMSGGAWVGPVYWEGACTVGGSHRGAAYVELLGALASALARPLARSEDVPKDRLIGRALAHPVAALGVATGVGWIARAVAGVRPSFADAIGEAARVDGGRLRWLAARARGRVDGGRSPWPSTAGIGALTLLRLARVDRSARFDDGARPRRVG